MNAVVLFFCLLLCAVNAVLWTFYTDMPLAGLAWAAAAALTVWLRKWSFN